MPDIKEPVTITLGCDDEISITLTETPSGTVFVSIASTDPAATTFDFDGLFFNLTDDSGLADLGFFPEPNTGSVFSPVTGLQTNADSVNTLSNGAQVPDSFDIGVQFGRVADSTNGEVTQANFTLFTNTGPLSLDDIDLDSLATVVDSDGGAGKVLTVNDAPGGGDVFIDTVSLFEDFADIDDPAQSAAIESDGGWDVRADQLFTNGSNDGELRLANVESEGPASFMFDARVNNLDNFESAGRYMDSLTLEVRTDGGEWQTLDVFTVNGDKSALVGSETGNEITQSSATLNYEGGILDDIESDVQFRLVSDISANNEKIFLDNFKVTTTEEVDGGSDGGTAGEAIKIDFEAATQSGDVVSDQFEGVTISAQRDGDRDTSENDAMIFDSDNTTGGDRDLGFDDQGNILIISEDNDSSDADDNARGGELTFEFDNPSDVVSINMLDIEERGGTIELFNADGEIINVVDIPTTGDGGSQELAIDTDGVSSMSINLVGSGAVDDLCFIPGESGDDDECDACEDVTYTDVIPMLDMMDANTTAAEEQMEEELFI